MDHRSIILISFGYFESDLLKDIAESVRVEFNVPVIIREGHIDLDEFFDPGRRQYNGMKLLLEIDSKYSADTLKVLGLFNVDLFIPILTYIFGQAYLNGRCGIASSYRFYNEKYGMNPDVNLSLVRLRKEIIHELGHTFGLIHCHNPSCVMRSSTYVEDIDQKEAKLCPSCRSTLGNSLSMP